MSQLGWRCKDNHNKLVQLVYYAYLLIQGANKDVVYVVVAVRALVYRLFYS